MTERLTTDEYFMQIAHTVANRGTCVRRKVGCVLVDAHRHIIATGYNGVPRGITHCIDEPCEGSSFPSGEGLTECQAVHGEINALCQCPDVNRVYSIYVTCSPCPHCFKALMNTGAKELIFAEVYPGWDKLAPIWESTGRTWKLA